MKTGPQSGLICKHGYFQIDMFCWETTEMLGYLEQLTHQVEQLSKRKLLEHLEKC